MYRKGPERTPSDFQTKRGSTVIRINALKGMIKSGERSYPIYLALMPAEQISEVADVPSYHDSTTNADIARNVSTVPVKEWQRPRITKKVDAIRQLFSNSGEFMPNPILIGESPHVTVRPTIEPLQVGGSSTSVCELKINREPSGAEKPLWILDGQHRIAGLSESAQSSNLVPVVFLLNEGSNYYAADTLAKIFAQVTTSATPLGSLHMEWLSYAFKLNHYSPQHVRSGEQEKAMEAVISLCMQPSLGGKPNPFYDRILYNDRLPLPRIQPGGHVYSCVELKEIVSDFYYSAQKSEPALDPGDLAREMCLARIALEDVIKTRVDRSVFFGTEKYHQKIMEDAFWAGVLRFLAIRGAPESWKDILRTLRFDSTNWDFSWKLSLHGRDQSTSKKLAIKVMENIFSKQQLPSGSDSIADLLRGNGAKFELEAFSLTSKGLRSAKQTKVLEVHRGDKRSFPIEPCVGIRLRNRSLNIQEVEVTDKQAAPGTLVPYKDVLRKGGMKLDETRHKNPLELLFTLKHYGGEESTASVQIDWKP